MTLLGSNRWRTSKSVGMGEREIGKEWEIGKYRETENGNQRANVTEKRDGTSQQEEKKLSCLNLLKSATKYISAFD